MLQPLSQSLPMSPTPYHLWRDPATALGQPPPQLCPRFYLRLYSNHRPNLRPGHCRHPVAVSAPSSRQFKIQLPPPPLSPPPLSPLPLLTLSSFPKDFHRDFYRYRSRHLQIQFLHSFNTTYVPTSTVASITIIVDASIAASTKSLHNLRSYLRCHL